jgi:large subunit ribosomal protein L29
MKIDEIRGKTGDEIDYELATLRKELFDLRFKSATQSLQSPARIQVLKRTIARLLTIQNERKAGIRGQKPR